MKIKRLLTAIAIGIPLFYCFQAHAQKEATKGFVINGRISGITQPGMVYLSAIKEQVILDSCPTVNGNFTLKGHVDHPTLCRLECAGEDAVMMIENTAFRFSSPIKQMNVYAIIKGGREQDLQNVLQALQRPYDSLCALLIDSINHKLYKTKEERKRLSQAYNANADTSQMVYVAFGKSHPNSYLGMDILYRNRMDIGKDTIQALLSKVKAPVKSSTEAIALDGFAYGKTTEKGLPIIDFTAKTIDGQAFTLSDLKGRYVLLNFWNPGCVPCLWEFKEINKHYDRLKDKLTIVSFNIGSNKDQWLATTKRSNIQWTNVSDLAGENGKIKTQYNVQGVPNSFLINPQGIIAETFTGYTEDTFIPKIESLLK